VQFKTVRHERLLPICSPRCSPLHTAWVVRVTATEHAVHSIRPGSQRLVCMPTDLRGCGFGTHNRGRAGAALPEALEAETDRSPRRTSTRSSRRSHPPVSICRLTFMDKILGTHRPRPARTPCCSLISSPPRTPSSPRRDLSPPVWPTNPRARPGLRRVITGEDRRPRLGR